MSKVATIKDVAKMAGVSPSTVTHSLNNKRPVNAQTKERIEQAIKTIGYIPSFSASGLRNKRSKIIGCLALDITEFFTSRIIKGLQEGLVDTDYSIVFASAIQFNNDFSKAIRFLLSFDCDGIIITYHIPSDVADLKLIKSLNIPVISVNTELEGIESITVNNTQAGKDAANYFNSLGVIHPVFIGGPTNRVSSNNRKLGFESILGPITSYHGEFSVKNGIQSAKAAFYTHPDTDGFFCANDYIAVGVINFINQNKSIIHHNIQVLGFDDRAFCSFFNPTISTFSQPFEEMGQWASTRLIQKIENQNDNIENKSFSATLIERETTSSNIS